METGYHKMKNDFKTMLHKEGTINKTKSNPVEWEKIFSKDIPDKGFIFKIYKELL